MVDPYVEKICNVAALGAPNRDPEMMIPTPTNAVKIVACACAIITDRKWACKEKEPVMIG